MTRRAGVKRTVLKELRRRTIAVEEVGGETRVVKEFHARNFFARLRDRRLAAEEHRILGRLHAAGLPVPRPLGVDRDGGHWRVAMSYVADSVELSRLLSGREAWRGDPATLAAECGRLLAKLHELGVDHADLYPGNVLVDASGAPWLIDFQGSKFRRRTTPSMAKRDLARLVRSTREEAGAFWRARFFVAWWRALPPSLQGELGNRAALLAEIEEEGRFERRAAVSRMTRMWVDAGHPCRIERTTSAELVVPRREPEGTGVRIAEAHGGSDTIALDDGRLAAIVRDTAAEAWFAAVRLDRHGIPGPAPLCLAKAAPGDHPWCALATAPPGPRPGPALLGRLLGQLHDRGLRPEPLDPLSARLGADSFAVLAPGVRLVDFDPRPGRATPDERFGPARDALPPRDRLRFLAAYLAAFRGPRAEREALRAELSRR